MIGAELNAARQRLKLALLASLLAVLFLLSLGIGPVFIAPSDVLRALVDAGSETHRIIVVEIRLPRSLLAILIGGHLGASGAAMQGLLRNPLAAPELFGAPQFAAFGAVAAISTGWVGTLSYGLPIAALIGALASVGLLLGVAGRHASFAVVILAGLAISSAAGAATALAMNLSPNPFAIIEIAFWLLGSLEDRSFRHVLMAAPFILAGSALLFAYRAPLRTLTLGEDAARSLGVDVRALRIIVVLGVACGIGGSVAVSGTIGFIGLVAPHLMRPLFGHDPARLMLPSALAGALLLTGADIAVRLIPATSDIKVGVFTSLIGVPFLLTLVFRERHLLGGRA